MPRRVHFTITNNPLGKDKFEKVHDPALIEISFFRGGYKHRLSGETGVIWEEQTVREEIERGEKIVLEDGEEFLILRLPRESAIAVHSITFPNGDKWDVINGWTKINKSNRTEPVTGPRW